MRTLTDTTALFKQKVASAWSAKADRLQSATGILLGCFLLVHLHFESSILFGKEAFYHVVQFLEGGMFSETGHGYPLLTSIFSTFLLVVVLVHAAFALRRFPAQIGQWRALRGQMQVVNHSDTRVWFWQLVSGFILFFLVPVHLYTMIATPEIGPHLSAERVYHDNAWLLYIVLLPAVVVHAMFGLYRVAVKWGISANRTGLRKLAHILVVYLMVIGLLSLGQYMMIGSELTLPIEPFRP
ncbi:fumarate reductase cytochrome b subunit [Shewanella fidelis]|uniref:Fumarate reductase cytochrome b subunit n=1 Tax=Shewanella fidelis TaxID=173509 RepID=A0AAW8NJM0_9GAMM|nr:fumarate reductase cytochrome b subunit [Shewanella fidelis]MDR8522108.1 fumarate reductase cytochrome b subunit [Shewanella fidelis]MDW4814122.1 fumarate reductase cytochrome b subunit [Shewanella fidelis]MDW4818279.1 fumarate reductase cytochrome b subunit [Shewanella fidelis]MDW4822411.1 fumarate reductase cytochrome b subunit [Shewanella fidelis]MDW4826535.1 fumarate reductase cytochrome b subunit [Shewanella fidelis]